MSDIFGHKTKANDQTEFELSSGTEGWLRAGVDFIEACKTQQTRNTKSNQIDTRMKKNILQAEVKSEEREGWMCVCVCVEGGVYATLAQSQTGLGLGLA